MSRTVVLVGPMGSGKSTVGNRLAARLGVDHVDTDELVEANAGREIAEIFGAQGEDAFRGLESDALESAMGGETKVISCGGGIVVRAANRERLRRGDALVVWLDASLDVLATRVGDGRGRPLLAGDVRAALAAKVAERAEGYAEVAALHLDTSDLGPVDCVDAILAELERVTA